MLAFAHIPTEPSNYRILIAAGGTGGHVYPAIAIANAMKAAPEQVQVLFVGTRQRMEWEAVPKAGYDIVNVWISGFHRRLTPKNLLFPIKLIVALWQSFQIIRHFKPDAVVACGGYVSGPVGWMAAKLGKPLFLQEQNSYPGVTNRLLAGDADTIFTAFEDAEHHFQGSEVTLTGNPVRSELRSATKQEGLKTFDFTDDAPVLLIIGGSGGARSVNEAMAKHIEALHHELGLQIIWQCGQKYYDEFSTAVNEERYPRLRLRAYLDTMPEAYAAADLVVSRAGALSCSEIQYVGKPSILVPSPHVAADHQTKNARSMVENGASLLLKDNEVSDQLFDAVRTVITEPEKLERMADEATAMARDESAETIARMILDTLKRTN